MAFQTNKKKSLGFEPPADKVLLVVVHARDSERLTLLQAGITFPLWGFRTLFGATQHVLMLTSDTSIYPMF